MAGQVMGRGVESPEFALKANADDKYISKHNKSHHKVESSRESTSNGKE
jgi:hypothetical protein